MVENANSARPTAMIIAPPFWVKTDPNAWAFNAVVPSVPMFRFSAPPSAAHRMVRPDREQITMVSMNTSKMPYRPCFTGSVSEVAA